MGDHIRFVSARFIWKIPPTSDVPSFWGDHDLLRAYVRASYSAIRSAKIRTTRVTVRYALRDLEGGCVDECAKAKEEF